MQISADPKDFDCIVILIPKSVIEQQDLDFTLSGLNKLLIDRETIRKSRGKLIVGIDGYDDDSREVYEILEVREYIQSVTFKFPYWFHFCSTKDHCLWIIFLSHCRFRKFGPGAAKIESEDVVKLMEYLFSHLNGFYRKHNLDESELISISRDVGEYFANPEMPSFNYE